MQTSRSSRVPAVPRLLVPLVVLLLWSRDRLATVEAAPSASGTSTAIGSAVLLMGVVAIVGLLGMNPLLTVGVGLGLAVLFVAARSWIVARERSCS